MKNIKDFYGMNLTNVTFINERARAYHMALNNASRDLWLVYCMDLWSEPTLMTKEALQAFRLRLKGKYVYTTVAIAPEVAAQVCSMVLVEEDIGRILI